MKIKLIIAAMGLFWGASGITKASAALHTKKTTVVYFGQQKPEEFELKIKPFFMDKVRSCKGCEIINFTPYTAENEVDIKVLTERIETLPESTSFVFFDFNMKVGDHNKDLLDLLNKKADSGLMVVGSAGAPKSSESSGPLSRTLLGQIHGALIIGELAERDRLMPTGFYGPEMLTAVRPPKEFLGQGFGPLIFAAALAENWQKRTPSEWSEYIRHRKMKNRKIWLEVNDLF